MKPYRLTHSVWELTLRCNMACLHCGSLAGSPRKEELETYEALALCDDLADLGCTHITFSGGEPLLRNDWRLLLAKLLERRIQVTMITNGYLVKENIDAIARSFAVICMSLDGLEQTHNHIRNTQGRDSWQRVKEAVYLLGRYGVQAGICTSVSKLNIHELPEMYRLLLGWKIKAWQIQMVFGEGRMKGSRDTLPSPRDHYHVAQLISEWRKVSPFLIEPAHDLGYHSHLEKDIRDTYWDGCHAGITSLGIESNGNIKGCLSLPSSFVEGNIRQKPLKDIWSSGESFAYNRRPDRRRLQKPCRQCPFYERCKCGCRSTTVGNLGTLYANPYCHYAFGAKGGGARRER